MTGLDHSRYRVQASTACCYVLDTVEAKVVASYDFFDRDLTQAESWIEGWVEVQAAADAKAAELNRAAE